MITFREAARLAKRLIDPVSDTSGAYMRAPNAKEDIAAIRRGPLIDGQNLDPGILLTSIAVDWMFTHDDLVLNGVRVDPSEGDIWRIQRPDGYFEYYDVLPDAEGRCFIPIHDGELIRVHTKLNRVEPPPQ